MQGVLIIMSIMSRTGCLVAVLVLFVSAWADKKLSLYPAETKGKWGLIDATGKWVVAAKFKGMGYFSEGLAPAQNASGKWGCVDEKGNWIIQPAFEDFSPFHHGLAVVQKGAGYTLVDRKGKQLYPSSDGLVQDYSEGMAVFSKMGADGYFVDGYLGASGKVVIPAKFYSAHSFHDGLALAADPAHKELWGYLAKSGKWAISPRFVDQVGRTPLVPGNFSQGLAAVADKAGKWGFIDKKGTWVISPQFADAGPFEEGVAYVRLAKGGLGYIDLTGKMVIGPKADLQSGSRFSEGLAAVSDKEGLGLGRWGYIDKTGTLVIPLRFMQAAAFRDGVAEVRIFKDINAFKPEGYPGLINRKGDVIHQNSTAVPWGH